MIVLTLTTIPPRFDNLHYTLNSIFSQTVKPDVVLLNIPKQYNNFSNDFELPKINHPDVIINRCNDYGPATKLLGLRETELYSKMSESDIIIVIDDDRNYNNRMIENFLYFHKIIPLKALTVAGWETETITNNKVAFQNKKSPRGVEFHKPGYIDVLGGCCGFLLTKSMCPFNHDEIFALLPDDAKYYVDDVWFSGFLTVNGTDIYLVPNVTRIDEPRNINNSISGLFDYSRNDKNAFCANYFRDKYNIWK